MGLGLSSLEGEEDEAGDTAAPPGEVSQLSLF